MAIWQNDGTKWRLATPEPYADEAALHSRVEEAPEILPLAGSPELVVVGREVTLGSNAADLIAVETSGRVVVIEVKLARNPEARRAVVSQILTYAAYLSGASIDTLERQILARHLGDRRVATIADLVAANDQKGSFDPQAFDDGLRASLSDGRFRLVLVLDSAPDELVQLVGYLALIAERVLIDLITVSAYDIGGTKVLVPQRVDPQKRPDVASSADQGFQGRLVEGSEDFEKAIERAKPDQQPLLRVLVNWAKELGNLRGVRLQTYHGKRGIVTLLPRLRADNAGLVSIYMDDGGGQLCFFRSVFERRAPSSIPAVESALRSQLKQGNTTREAGEELLAALTDAYREAELGNVAPAQRASSG